MQASEPLMNDYVDSGRVNFEFRSFVIHGPLDLALTRLVDCGTPEQAVPLADQVWANLPTIMQPLQERGPQLEAALNLPEDQRFVAFADTAGLLDFFAARGVSRDQARTCLADAGRLSEIADVSETYGTQDDITQTPTFVLNGKKLDDTSWTAIEAALQRAGARERIIRALPQDHRVAGADMRLAGGGADRQIEAARAQRPRHRHEIASQAMAFDLSAHRRPVLYRPLRSDSPDTAKTTHFLSIMEAFQRPAAGRADQAMIARRAGIPMRQPCFARQTVADRRPGGQAHGIVRVMARKLVRQVQRVAIPASDRQFQQHLRAGDGHALRDHAAVGVEAILATPPLPRRTGEDVERHGQAFGR